MFFGVIARQLLLELQVGVVDRLEVVGVVGDGDFE